MEAAFTSLCVPVAQYQSVLANCLPAWTWQMRKLVGVIIPRLCLCLCVCAGGGKPPVSQITPPAPGTSNTTGGGGPTPPSQVGFKAGGADAARGEQLTVVAVEVHADSRGALLPDPR